MKFMSVTWARSRVYNFLSAHMLGMPYLEYIFQVSFPTKIQQHIGDTLACLSTSRMSFTSPAHDTHKMDSPSKAATLPVCPKTLKAYENTQIR
jgi:hypothetical protein